MRKATASNVLPLLSQARLALSPLDDMQWCAVCTSICCERTWRMHDHDASIPKLKRFCICLPSRNESMRDCFELFCQRLSHTISSLRPARGLAYCDICNFVLSILGIRSRNIIRTKPSSSPMRRKRAAPGRIKWRLKFRRPPASQLNHSARELRLAHGELVTDHVSESLTKRKPAVFAQRGYLAAEDNRVSIYCARAGQTGCRNPKLALATDQKVWPTSRALSKDLAFLPRNSESVQVWLQLNRLDGHVVGQMRLT